MSIKTNPVVAEYLARTRAALADLPASEVREIVEDIGPHLAEVAAELGDNVTVDRLGERLGTPEQYASELRAAAGYPPARLDGQPPTRLRTLPPRFALWALVLAVLAMFVLGLGGVRPAVDTTGGMLLVCLPLLIALIPIFTGRVRPAEVAELSEVRAARRALESLPDTMRDYLRALRPAWWLARLVILGGVLLAVLGDAKIGWVWWPAAALVALIWVGPRSRTDRRWTWVVAPANALAVGLGLALIGTLWSQATSVDYGTARFEPGPYGTFNDGRPVRNIYVFGPDGKPLPEVYLYDQDGQPIMIMPDVCAGRTAPSNKFPQARSSWDDATYVCTDRTDVPFTVAIPTTPPNQTTTTSSASTSPPPATTK